MSKKNMHLIAAAAVLALTSLSASAHAKVDPIAGLFANYFAWFGF
jgi:hypothetical protein